MKKPKQTKRYTPHIDDTTPAIILVRPQLGENIGSAARAAMNFGLSDLRIVAPRDGWPNAKAHEMSAHADWMIERAKIFDTLAEALADCNYSIASTARNRDINLPCFTPENAGQEMQNRRTRHEKTAFVFGPENHGLSNDEISLCNAIVTVPTHPSNPSLNLAQGVVVISYAWFSATTSDTKSQIIGNTSFSSDSASNEEITGLYNHLNDALEEKGFYRTEAIKPVIQRNFRALLSRACLTEQETRTLRGMVRFLVGK